MFIAVTLFLPQGIVGPRAAATEGSAGLPTDEPVSRVPRIEERRSAGLARAGRELSRRAPGSSTRPTAPILYLDDITVSFDGFKALNALSL